MSSTGHLHPKSVWILLLSWLGGIVHPLEKLQPDLREFIELLNSHKVKYLIVGGHAVAYHGFPRYTGDFDFFIGMSETNANAMMAVLQAFGFGSLGIERETFLKPNQIIQLGVPPNRIDLLTSISGVDFELAWQQRESANLDSLPVHFIGQEQLIANKEASGRPKDLGDLSKLRGH